MAALVEFDKPREKRTHAQVVAAEAKVSQAAAERARERQAAMDRIVELDALEAAALAKEDDNTVYNLDDLEAAGHKDDEEFEFNQEDFDRVEDEDAYLSSSAFDDPKKARAAPKKAKKPVKFETRREIEAAVKQLVANGKKKVEAKDVVKKKGVQNSDAAAASRNAGLSTAWKKKTAESSDAVLGGLTDDDAGAARPDFDKPENAFAPRKNTMVKIVDLSSDTDDTPSKIPAPTTIKPVRKPHAIKVEAKIPALTVKPRGSKTSKTHAESSSSSFTPASSSDVNGLPAFIGRTWTTRFLPAARRLLYESHTPLSFATVGTDPINPGKETVEILQNLLNELYPGTGWRLEWGDPICGRAVARLRERRSAIATAADSKYYTNDTPAVRLSNVIAADAKDALRPGGSAFYKNPTPLNDPEVKPRGFLEGEAVIAAVAPHMSAHDWTLGFTQDSEGNDVVDYSELPVGLLGMGAAAAERAYGLHTTGNRTKPRDFSAANYGTAVAGYIHSIKSFKASRWQSIIEACGAAVSEPAFDEEVNGEISLDGVRETMYIPSSP
ncbi:hypothetical protein B0H19DRAFT_1239830 [Mycena capillaripes]|nr:hypothetical protein B0H19DRAFT_1239830 [Mycena capillaripes]